MVLFISALISAASDLLVKKKVNELDPSFSRDCLSGNVQIKRMSNSGFAGSRMADRPRLVKAVSLLSFSLLLVGDYLSLKKHSSVLTRLSLGLITGGAFGNVHDRLTGGSVTDYIRFPRCRIPFLSRLVYNLADLYLFFGSLLFLLLSLFEKEQP